MKRWAPPVVGRTSQRGANIHCRESLLLFRSCSGPLSATILPKRKRKKEIQTVKKGCDKLTKCGEKTNDSNDTLIRSIVLFASIFASALQCVV